MSTNSYARSGLKAGLAALCLAGLLPAPASGEAMLQYFNTTWKEIADRMPELAEAGYSSIWLPPPTKGSGGLSVGYDLVDPFDLGGRNQRGTVTTRYGTEAELLNLIETAHRFGIRIYLDNIMNHRAFDVPAYNEGTAVDVYPGMVPEDFHLRVTEDGFYRKWDNCRDWGSAWQVQNLGLADLIDIAHETPNDNFGSSEGDDHPKPSFVRHPYNPEFYDRMPNLAVDPSNWDPNDWTGNTNKNIYIGFGTNNGLTTNILAQYPAFFTEDVGGYLCRNVRWLMAVTKADGLRLDAVKHVPDYFFGAYNNDGSSAGYCGNAQWQFNMTHGYTDWSNHRDSCFSTEIPRDDAMMFGEHLGEPPGYGGYWAVGMRLVDNPLRNELNNRLGSMWNGLAGFDSSGAGGFSAETGVMHAQSHDNDYAACKELQHAFYFLRAGLGLLYTDGNHHAETLGESGGAFPRWANTAFLGQWSDGRVPNLLYCNEQFGRGYQRGVWGDADYVAWERLDWRQGGSTDGDKVTMLVMLNDNYSAGLSRSIAANVSFPHQAGGAYGADAYLYNYSTYGGGFYTYASALGSVIVPGGGYFIFGYKNPDPSPLWSGFGGQPVTIYQNDTQVDTVAVVRKDGPDGDAAFNPYGLTDTNSADYSYTVNLPRITSATNVAFVARVDGSAGNVLLKLDGGMNLNSASNALGDMRDNPPALANDVYQGYEQADFVKRIWGEKFAAVASARAKLGSAGAETYIATIGQPNWSTNLSTGSNDWDGTTTVSWIFHDPQGTQDRTNCMGCAQFWPALTNAANQTLYINVKTPKVTGNRVFIYYTTNGTAWPEGAGGAPGNSSTRVAEAAWSGTSVDTNDWWQLQVPAMPSGTVFRYKVGSARQQGYGGNSYDVVWPGGASDIARKTNMLGVWQVTNLNLATLQYRPHGDYGETRTGLKDGLHLLSARAFLNRNDGCSIYNTFKQTFYLDAETPQGYIQWPANNGDILSGSEYGVVVRTDPTVREVWYRLEDGDSANDDAVVGKANGNGTGFEPYTDANADGNYDTGEPFTDLDKDGVWDSTGVTSWQPAYATTPGDMSTAYPLAWRFTYANLPTGGTATIKIRLREWSSAERPAWTNGAMTTNTGHYTELTRTVTPAGPNYRLYFDWPQTDGALVEAGWTIRVKYSQVFADGADALSLFTLKLNSTENGGDPANGTVLSPADVGLTNAWGWPESTLTFTMPNVYNGSPDWLHSFEIVGQRNGYPTLRATRKVTTRGELLPSILITEPPELTSDGEPYEIILPDVAASVLATNPALRTTTIRLATGTNGVATGIFFTVPAGYSGAVAAVSATNIGSTIYWDYAWSNLTAGTFRFTAWVRDGAGLTNTASRNVTLTLRQVVDTSSTNDLDHDDDGMTDTEENTVVPLPNGFPDTDPRYQANSEYWTNRDIVVHNSCGRSLPESPDSDGDGLSDGLELGWRLPHLNTDTNADTNGDGWKNFRPDLDPPFYNTLDNYGRVPGVDSVSAGGDRSKYLRGSTTDPTNPDTDYDGLPDGVEDQDRNGWVNGDGAVIQPDWLPWAERDWPTGDWDANWTETDPGNADTDGDGLHDGYGEDQNFNGRIDGDSNSNRVWNAGEHWTETDPLDPDTDNDGLPDGWESRYNLDPWDDGIVGHTNMHTGAIIASTEHGASGNPDGDTFTNLTELQNSTNPREYDEAGGQPPEEGTITVGQGAALGAVNGATNYQEFTDWTLDDLIALDDYNNGGSQAVDIYRRWDGYDTSRDLVAFYMRDGGAADDKVYFRVDFEDLQANAEQGALDIYVMIDFNSTGTGEAALPDAVDGRTSMKWEAAVAVYDSQSGALYVDGNPAVNTLTEADSLAAAGVAAAPGGFLGAYFNSELDAVEFAVDRSVLVAAGWNGIASTLNFQVFTTKDGTGNSPLGAGDIGGRIDTCDIIRNTWLCSDYWRDQDYIIQNPILTQWVGKSADNNCGQAAKIALLAHGNQAIQPGSYIHGIVDDNAGAGYQRPVKIHGIYQVPLNLHITPTLASALEWAEVKTNGPAWRSGTGLNDQIRALVASNVISLMGSTYSDHILPYFTKAFNSNNVALASETLNRIYGANINSNSVFWPPERVLDADTFGKILDLGFHYTLVDQNTHIWNWYGRTVALGDDGYRINEINGVKCFVINNAANDYRFANDDNGLPVPLRELFSRRARSGSQNQVATIFTMWEDFNTLAHADAYDKNVRWLANHPWMQLVSLEDIAQGNVTLPGGQTWEPIDRGATASSKQSHDWINHATAENYDHWYTGSAIRESLQTKKFLLRPGVTNATAYGMLYSGGLVSNAWTQVAAIANPDVKRLAGEVLHASVFETAFHNENNHDLSRWSSGGYIYPSTDWQDLADFAKNAQNQTRMAALYTRVDIWAAAATGLVATVATNLDADLDGEAEYWLYNRNVATVFERIGGRLIAAWLRTSDGRVRQMMGNLAAYAGGETEEEGAWSANTNTGAVVAYRTSGLKDWWANTPNYVNDLYTVTTNGVTNGWKLTSSDSKIAKTVTLAPTATNLAVQYTVSPTLNGGALYVRNGFSPDLSELLVNGQNGLTDTFAATGGVVTLATTATTARITLSLSAGVVNTTADDDGALTFDSVPMRNQAQTRQVEVVGTNTLAFTLGFYAEDANEPAPATVYLGNLAQTYSGAARTVTATTMPAGLTVSLTYAGHAWAPTNAGSYAVTGTVTSTNYVGATNGTLIVSKVGLTATAAAQSKPYGATNPPLTFQYSGFVNGEGASALTAAPTATTTVGLATAPGVYTGAITLSGGSATNYSFSYVAGNFTVTEAISSGAVGTNNNNVALTFGPLVNGSNYVLQFRASLLTGDWVNVTNMVGSGQASATLTHTNGATNFGYYRILGITGPSARKWGYARPDKPGNGKLNVVGVPFFTSNQTLNSLMDPLQFSGHYNNAGQADQLMMWNPATTAYVNLALYDLRAFGSQYASNTGWKAVAGFGPGAAYTNPVLPAGSAVWIRGSTTNDRKVAVAGEIVMTGAATNAIVPGLQLLANPFSEQVALSNLAIRANAEGHYNNAGQADQIMVWNAGAQGYQNLALYDLRSFGAQYDYLTGWKAVAGFGPTSAYVNVTLKPGDGFWFRAVNGSFTWVETNDYKAGLE